MRSVQRVIVAAVCVLSCAAPLRAGELKFAIADGKVTLIATDVPARQILEEWARVGQTKIVNAEKLPPTMLTLTLEDVPEAQALEIVLRSASGYLAAPRIVASTGTSVFDRIVIMPTSIVVASAAPPRPATAPTPQPQPAFVRPPAFPGATAPDDQEAPVPQPAGVVPPNTALAPGMPGYIAPPVVQPGVIPQYPGAPVTMPNPQAPPPPPQYPFVPGVAPGAPGSISQPGGVPQLPNVINPLAPKRPGGSQ